MGDEGAKRLGEKLLAEVEVEDLSSVLESLRDAGLNMGDNVADNEATAKGRFGIAELDNLVPSQGTLVLELVSPPLSHHPSGAGKTSLLYPIISRALLPATMFPSLPVGGQNAVVILFDPLNRFSVPRLTRVILSSLKSRLSEAGAPVDDNIKSELKRILARSLLHLHIFRPQSWPSLLSTLNALPGYLFDNSRQKSIHRRVHSIILEDIDTFAWSIRNPALDASGTLDTISNPLSTASTQLTTHLHRLSTLFACHTILTSRSVSTSGFRPALPTSWPHGSTVTRLALRRIDVVKFAPAISVEEAEVKRQQRWEVVSKGRFECWKVGTGMKGLEGFVFRVGVGIEIEGKES